MMTAMSPVVALLLISMAVVGAGDGVCAGIGTGAGVSVGAGMVVSELKSAISSVAIWVRTGIGMKGGTSVDTGGAMCVDESKTAGVVAITGWTFDWVRALVCNVVPWCSCCYSIFTAFLATFCQRSVMA